MNSKLRKRKTDQKRYRAVRNLSTTTASVALDKRNRTIELPPNAELPDELRPLLKLQYNIQTNLL